MVELTEKILKSKEVKKDAITFSTHGKHELCYTPLLIAVDMGHLKIVELFFKYKEKRHIDLNDPCGKTGYTALHIVCKNDQSGPCIGMQCNSAYDEDVDNSIPMLELFLNNAEEKKIKLFEKDRDWRGEGYRLTPFELAISYGQVKPFKVLLEYFEKKRNHDHGSWYEPLDCRKQEK